MTGRPSPSPPRFSTAFMSTTAKRSCSDTNLPEAADVSGCRPEYGPAPGVCAVRRAGLRARAVVQPGVPHSLDLAGGELGVAGIVGVVHVVVDRVEPRLTAGVLALWASAGRDLLGRGVVDEIALGVASAGERVLQVQ